MVTLLSSCTMQENILKEGLVRILKVCCRNGFFNLRTTKNSLTAIQYGPLGSLFTRNIWREWLSSLLNNTDASMFPIEVMKSGSHMKLQQFSLKSFAPFLPDAFKNYFKVLPLVGVDIPCGFAAYGPVAGIDQSEALHDNSMLRKFESKQGLSIVFFCPMKKSSDWFNYWARYRYRWWRKFSSIPSKFSMSDVTETEAGNQEISLMMEFPWGKENIETITLYEEKFFKTSCLTMGLRLKSLPVSSSIIVCESELTLAAFAYLSNSFTQKFRDGEVRKLFQLHTKLAPYKVCFAVNSDDSNDLKSLIDVAKHLEKDLKKYCITVFPCFCDSKKESVSLYSRYDEMGVPYTIVLNKNTLHSGVAGLRNRDTTLEEQVHITELTPKLLKYLQMKSSGIEES